MKTKKKSKTWLELLQLNKIRIVLAAYQQEMTKKQQQNNKQKPKSESEYLQQNTAYF